MRSDCVPNLFLDCPFLLKGPSVTDFLLLLTTTLCAVFSGLGGVGLGSGNGGGEGAAKHIVSFPRLIQ